MKRVLYLLMALFLWTASFSYAQEVFYYTYKTKKLLDTIKQRIAIKLVSDIDVESVLSQFPFLEIQSMRERGRDLYILSLESGENYLHAREKLLSSSRIIVVHPVYITKQEGVELYITDEICVQFLKETPISFIDEIIQEYDLQVVRKLDVEPYYLMRVPRGSDVLKIANEIAEKEWLLYSHPNFYDNALELCYNPLDEYFNRQWNFSNTGQGTRRGTSTPGADIKILPAWDITLGLLDIQVTVIDDGLDLNHEDISSDKIVPGYDFADGDDNVQPVGSNAHGTHCTGLIGADHDTVGIAGIAPNVKLQMMKIFRDNGSAASNDDVARAIDSARTQGADVISNSWGFSGVQDTNYVPAIRQAILRAVNQGRNGKGCVVVFSASNTANRQNGNTGVISFPASMPQVITVAASDRNDKVANYSPNCNPSANVYLDLAAPSHKAYPSQIPGEGFEVWSTDISGAAGYNPGTSDTLAGDLEGNYSADFGGTSAACPQVAGAAALILSLDSTLTVNQVTDILTSTADKVGGYNYNAISNIPGVSLELGYGRLNVSEALQSISTMPFTFINRIAGTEDYGYLILDNDITNPVPSGDTLWFSVNTQHVVRTDELPFIPNWQNSGTSQKHHRFYNTNPDYSLNHQFTASGTEPTLQDANFEETKTATVKTFLLSANSSGGSIEFSDSWRYYQDSGGNWQQSNQFISYSSPLVMDNDNITDYGGVFLDQDPNQTSTYYSVKAPTQTIPVNGKQITYDLESWTTNGAEVTYPTGSPTPVIFRNDGATVTANLKGRRAADTPKATIGNNSFGIAPGRFLNPTPRPQLIYNDRGNIYYVRRNDANTAWHKDQRLSALESNVYNSSPAINGMEDENYATLSKYSIVAWESLDSNPPQRYVLKAGYLHHTATGMSFSELSFNPGESPVPFHPSVAGYLMNFSRHSAVVAYESSPMMDFSQINLWFTRDNHIEAVPLGNNGEYPSLDYRKHIGDGGTPYYYLAWQDPEGIRYTEFWRVRDMEEVRFENDMVLNQGYTTLLENRKPALYSKDNVYVVWQATEEIEPPSKAGAATGDPIDPYVYHYVCFREKNDPGVWQPLVKFITNNPNDRNPVVTAFESGGFSNSVIAYQDKGDEIKYISGIYGNEEWTTPVVLSENGQNPAITTVDNQVHAIWTESDKLPYRVLDQQLALEKHRTTATAPHAREAVFNLKKAIPGIRNLPVDADMTLKIADPLFISNGTVQKVKPRYRSSGLSPTNMFTFRDIDITTVNTTLQIPVKLVAKNIKRTQNGARFTLPLLRLRIKDANSGQVLATLHTYTTNVLYNDTLKQIVVNDTFAIELGQYVGRRLQFQGKTFFGKLGKYVSIAEVFDLRESAQTKEYTASLHKTGNSENVPDNFQLFQNYPNPFNPETVIRFALPQQANVKLTIYDVSGRQVRTLVNEPMSAGYHTALWDGSNENGVQVGTGVYFYHIIAGEYSHVRKMLLVR